MEECLKRFEWNYLGWKDYKNISDKYTQVDYNQELVTKINQCHATIFQFCRIRNLKTCSDKIFINKELLPLIETFDYYRSEDNTLSGHYNIIIDDSISKNIIKIVNNNNNDIYLYGEIKVLNYTSA